MHGMHARLPKNFILEERLERYASLIELEPARLAGCWAEACHPLEAEGCARYACVCVDLGCGKGAYVVKEAAAHPDTLYVAIDGESYMAERYYVLRLQFDDYKFSSYSFSRNDPLCPQ